MSSTAGALLGKQEPRVAHTPNYEWTHADDAAFLASSYGLTPDPWQMAVLEAWFAVRPDGKWSASRCGLSVPRQNGKNGAIEVRELYGMVALGEKFLHSAHEVKTARKAFLRLASFFENPRKFPELAEMVVEIRKTNGQEAIVLANGGSVEFVARSRGSGRGFTVDVLVLDEAQELTDEMLEAMVPAISSAPLGNPQRIFAGTPPGPNANGEAFTRVRDDAGKARRLSWHEWSVEGRPDIHDPEVWALANPSLGIRLNVETIEDELGDLSPEGFLRERLGRWSTKSDAQVIPPAWWSGTLVSPDDALRDGVPSFALDMPQDRSSITIGACRRPLSGDGPRHIELVRHELTESVGTGWAVDWLAERWPDTAAVVIDSYSPAATLVPDLLKRRVKVTVTRTGDMVKACGVFFDASRDAKITHIAQPGIDRALEAAGKKLVGDAGGWVWDRRNPDVDISPLVAVTLALYGSLTTKRNPTRKTKVVLM